MNMNDKLQKVADITPDKFEFVNGDDRIHDLRFDTKPIGYFKDAWNRFKKNKASVVAAIIISIVTLFGIIAPWAATYDMSEADGYYSRVRPKIASQSNTNNGFWDGTYTLEQNNNGYIYYTAIALGALDKTGSGDVSWDDAYNYELNPVRKVLETYVSKESESSHKRATQFQKLRIDSYYQVGFIYVEGVTEAEYDKILDWQNKTGKQVLYPIIDENNEEAFDVFNKNTVSSGNYWYAHDARYNPLDASGKIMTLEQVKQYGLTPNYIKTVKVDEHGVAITDANGDYIYETAFYTKMGKSENYKIRVLYYNYYQYLNGHEPNHAFGSDSQGYDIFIRMAKGIRLSLVLSICVSLINFIIGAFYGAIEGYYGGWIDMIMERLTDILSGIPFIILATLFKLYFVDTGKVSAVSGLLFAFVLTGWIGTSYSVRMQFYRFKHQEYILAARTLGAKDLRLMFRHIFPNSLGTLITSSVLVIPGVIFAESSLAYLGIINFNGTTITSLGTMLANGQTAGIDRFPHIIFFPALIISLLMISFNLFGNGLRDAFNPSLRGSEE